jgi:hypothetical protein
MKKRLMLICLGCICITTANAQVLGLKGGLSFARGRYVLYEVETSTGSLFGVNTGIVGEVPLSDALALGSGISLIKKGTKSDVYKIPVRYLEFPVNLIYRIDFVTWKLFVQAGPYVGVGISAKKKSNVTDKIKFGPEAFQFKRMDTGINFGGGFEINNLQIGANYGYGFINISHAYREVIRNRVFTISAVYYIEDLGDFFSNIGERIF